MPVWHATTRDWVESGQLVVLGVTQEQHAERCRLFAQWQQFSWPILHDPINVLEATAVPIVVAIDEHGIVRSNRPDRRTFAKDFLNRRFADDAPPAEKASITPEYPVDFDRLQAEATARGSATAWRRYGDALSLWGDDSRLNAAIEAYREALRLDRRDGPAWFRLGVQLKRRSELPVGGPDDFRGAVEAWGEALAIDPNQYIWRRRIQQYGPRLEKPYPFYDWVTEAESAIRARGEEPIQLTILPRGAELTAPTKTFPQTAGELQNPDPDGRIQRDTGSVVAEAIQVPATVSPGDSARVHLILRLSPSSTDHWNNEADPLQVWLDPPEGTVVSTRQLIAPSPPTAHSTEDRSLEFEVQLPQDAQPTLTIPAFALYHVCDEDQGSCRFLRLDFRIELRVSK